MVDINRGLIYLIPEKLAYRYGCDRYCVVNSLVYIDKTDIWSQEVGVDCIIAIHVLGCTFLQL